MRNLRFACCAISAFAYGTAAMAQSKPGVSFEQTLLAVTTARGRTDTTTTLLHTTSAGGDGRIEVEKGRFPNMGPFSPGPHAVIIMHDGGNQFFFLNTDEKQYLSLKPFEMIEGVQKMLDGMGGSMSFDTAGTGLGLDSVGPGPSIDGHPTLTYRLRIAMKMTMSMLGQSNVVDTQSSEEIQVAPDLGDYAGVASMNRFAELTEAMGFPKSYYEKLAATRRKIRGFTLRAVTHTTTTANGVTRTRDQTIETRNVRRLAVSDSLFVVPADYKPVKMPLPGMPAH